MKTFRNFADRRRLDADPLSERVVGGVASAPGVEIARTNTAPPVGGNHYPSRSRMVSTTAGTVGVAGNRPQIFLVDPHVVVVRGLVAMIETDAEFAVCGRACTVVGALRNISEQPVDLIITGLNFPDCQGVDAVTRLKASFPQIPLLVFTCRPDCARAAMQAGAQGCVDKAEDWDTLSAAIRCVVSGGVYLSHTAVIGFTGTASLNGCVQTKAPERVLSRQEMAIFEKIGEGFMPSEIAADLNVSVRTVESYCGRIRDKLDIASSAVLRRRAVNWMHSKADSAHHSA